MGMIIPDDIINMKKSKYFPLVAYACFPVMAFVVDRLYTLKWSISMPPVLDYVADQPKQQDLSFESWQVKCWASVSVCEMLCHISRLCLGATVHKEGQPCWSSQHCLQLDIWTQFTVGLPAVAEAKASHQKLRPGTRCHGNSVVQAKHRNPHVLYLQ